MFSLNNGVRGNSIRYIFEVYGFKCLSLLPWACFTFVVKHLLIKLVKVLKKGFSDNIFELKFTELTERTFCNTVFCCRRCVYPRVAQKLLDQFYWISPKTCIIGQNRFTTSYFEQFKKSLPVLAIPQFFLQVEVFKFEVFGLRAPLWWPNPKIRVRSTHYHNTLSTWHKKLWKSIQDFERMGMFLTINFFRTLPSLNRLTDLLNKLCTNGCRLVSRCSPRSPN